MYQEKALKELKKTNKQTNKQKNVSNPQIRSRREGSDCYSYILRILSHVRLNLISNVFGFRFVVIILDVISVLMVE